MESNSNKLSTFFCMLGFSFMVLAIIGLTIALVKMEFVFVICAIACIINSVVTFFFSWFVAKYE